jgi:hypothetical protein
MDIIIDGINKCCAECVCEGEHSSIPHTEPEATEE